MKVEVFSDGSATVKTKPGGYGFVVVIDGKVEETGSGGLPLATNNDAELEGAIAGLKAAKKIIYDNPRHFNAESTVTLVSDSEIVLGWVDGTYRFKQESKMDRYIELSKLVNQLRVQTRWVEGHSGDQYNEECDRLANEARKALLPPEEQKPKKEKKSKVSTTFGWNKTPAPMPQSEIWDPSLNRFRPQDQDMRTDRDKLFNLDLNVHKDVIVRIVQELVLLMESKNG